MDGSSGSAIVSLAVGVGAALYLLYSRGVAGDVHARDGRMEHHQRSRGKASSTSSVDSVTSSSSSSGSYRQSSVNSVARRQLFTETEDEDDEDFFEDLSFRGVDPVLRLVRPNDDVSGLEILDDDFDERARRRLPHRAPLTSTPIPSSRPVSLAPQSAPSRVPSHSSTPGSNGSHPLTPVPQRVRPATGAQTAMRAPSSGASKTPGKRSGGRGPFLIRNLNSTMTAKVLGEMTYNPESCSWEGNDEAASIFDQPAPRARPALVSNFGGASRPQVVNGMVYDPKQRLWLGNEAEADPFKDIDALPTSEDAQSGHLSGGTAFTVTPAMMENWRQSEVQHKRLVANWQQFQNLDHLEHLHMIRDIASKLSS